MTQILIIGAGPAGCSCAIQLRKMGLDVLVIDHVDFPRFRPGESCHPGIEPLLKQLGVWKEIIKLNPERFDSIWINRDGAERQHFFSKQEKWKGFQLPREEFDHILLNKAIELGARFIPQVRTLDFKKEGSGLVSIITNIGEIEFDFLVDGTGTRSISTIKLGLEPILYSEKIICSYLQLLSPKVNAKHSSYFEITDSYWGYISKIKDDKYSVTFSTDRTSCLRIEDFAQKHFGHQYRITLCKAFETSWSLASAQSFKNLYCVGDALMTFDPTSSKGILKSIITGVYAADTLNRIIREVISIEAGKQAYWSWAKDFLENEIESMKNVLPVGMASRVFGLAHSEVARGT